MQSQPEAPSDDYASSTLPLTKREKRRHSYMEPAPLGAPQHQLGPIQPLLRGRRASIATSASHHGHALPLHAQQHIQPHMGDASGQQQHKGLHSQSVHTGKRRILPMTPNENPYQPPEGLRSHSRAESAPDPLPVPFRYSIAPHNQLAPMQQPHQYSGGSGTVSQRSVSPTISPQQRSRSGENSPKILPPVLKESIVVSPTSPQAAGSIYSNKHASKKKLRPLRTKSSSNSSRQVNPQLSKSIDGLNLQPAVLMAQPGSHNMPNMSWQQARTIQGRRNSLGTAANQGWASSTQRLGQPADIRGLMVSRTASQDYDVHRLDISGRGRATSPHGRNNSNTGSVTSVDINPELFSPTTAGGVGGESGHSSHSTTPMGSKGSSPQGPTPLGPSPQASKSHFKQASSLEQGGKISAEHTYYYNQQVGLGDSSTGKGNPHPIPQGWQQPPHQKIPPAQGPYRTTSAKLISRLHPQSNQQVPPDMTMSVGHIGGEAPSTRSAVQNLPKIPNAQADKVGDDRTGYCATCDSAT